jgi:hypothetical protein
MRNSIVSLLNNLVYGKKNKKNLDNFRARMKARQNAVNARIAAAKKRNNNGRR